MQEFSGILSASGYLAVRISSYTTASLGATVPLSWGPCTSRDLSRTPSGVVMTREYCGNFARVSAAGRVAGTDHRRDPRPAPGHRRTDALGVHDLRRGARIAVAVRTIEFDVDTVMVASQRVGVDRPAIPTVRSG